MNPARRFNPAEAFNELRAIVEHAYTEAHHQTESFCEDCKGRIFLIRGKRSGKYFWTHEGLRGCTGVRAIMFDTREEAEKAEFVFK